MKVYEVKTNYKWFRFYVNILLIIQAIFITFNCFIVVSNFKYIFEVMDWYNTSFVVKVFFILIIEIIQVALFINQLVKTRNKKSTATLSILITLWYVWISNTVIYLLAFEDEKTIGNILGITLYSVPNLVYFYHRTDGFNDYVDDENVAFIENNKENN